MRPTIVASLFLVESLMTLGASPPFANHTQATTYVLSGVAARALNAAIRKELANGVPSSRLAVSTVHVAERPTSVAVRFDWPNASTTQLSVDLHAQAVHIVREAQIASNEVILPGLDAVAIAATIQALESALVRLNFRVTRADFNAGHFQIQEHAAFPSPTDKPGYYVAYIPAAHLPCPSYTIYRVDPVTFAVYEQPRIC